MMCERKRNRRGTAITAAVLLETAVIGLSAVGSIQEGRSIIGGFMDGIAITAGEVQAEPAELSGIEAEPDELPGIEVEPDELPGIEVEPAELPGIEAEPAELSGQRLEQAWSLGWRAETTEVSGQGQEAAGTGAVQDVLNRISRYCSTRILYQFGDETELLDGETIVSWILYDASTGTIHLDRNKIREYVAGLAEQYDTYQKPREFQTSFGDWVTVNGGSYGWLLDQESEARVLEHLIRSGAARTRVPKFAHTAADWSHSDLGDTYVEVDLTNQRMWLYVDGIRELETDCVTGTYTDESRKTPSGTYTIYSMMSPAVLKGPDWNSPVSYWMPFNGGIGLHDATWRTSFGGSIFMYSGSHGCVNLPYGAAERLYGYAYTGMPVICYYR